MTAPSKINLTPARLGALLEAGRRFAASPELCRPHTFDLVTRKDGIERRIEAEWVRDAMLALPDLARRVLELERRVDDLAMILRMLVRHVPDDKKITAGALDYLRRHGLEGSPLRDAGAIAAEIGAMEGER